MELKQLESSLSDFLTVLLVEKRPDEAVAKYLSRRLSDETLVPSDAYSVEEYSSKFSSESARAEPRNVANEEIAGRVERYLVGSLREVQDWSPKGIGEALLPIGPDDAPELWDAVREADRQPERFSQLKAFHYPVSRWEDVSWTATATVGYRQLPRLSDKHGASELRAVVCWLKSPISEDAGTTLMLWAHERQNSENAEWKLWGIEPVPSR